MQLSSRGPGSRETGHSTGGGHNTFHNSHNVAGSYLVHFDKLPIIIYVDVVPKAAPVRVEAVRETRPIKPDIIKSTPIECLLSLVDRVHTLEQYLCAVWDLRQTDACGVSRSNSKKNYCKPTAGKNAA